MSKLTLVHSNYRVAPVHHQPEWDESYAFAEYQQECRERGIKSVDFTAWQEMQEQPEVEEIRFKVVLAIVMGFALVFFFLGYWGIL